MLQGLLSLLGPPELSVAGPAPVLLLALKAAAESYMNPHRHQSPPEKPEPSYMREHKADLHQRQDAAALILFTQAHSRHQQTRTKPLNHQNFHINWLSIRKDRLGILVFPRSAESEQKRSNLLLFTSESFPPNQAESSDYSATRVSSVKMQLQRHKPA